MASVTSHIAAIHELFQAAASARIPLWLENGWGIDALLGEVRRKHEDIDIAYPEHEQDRLQSLVEGLGYKIHEWTDYGFVARRGEIELDMDRCVRRDDGYTFEGYPADSCPLAPTGIVAGMAVRCVTWDAMYLEMLAYQREIPTSECARKITRALR